jgi:hypothetical protein
MTIDRIIGLLSIPLMLIMVAGIARQVNKNQRVSIGSTLIGLVMAPIILIINLLFMARAIPTSIGPFLLILGLGFGLAWGFTTRLKISDGVPVARQSILHLVFWAISLTVTQLLAAFAPVSWVAGGLATMFFSTGTTVGSQLNLLVRQRLQVNKLGRTPAAYSADSVSVPAASGGKGRPEGLPERKRPTSLPRWLISKG